MTNEQAKKMLKAKLECLKRETSGTDFDCNNSNCDECSLNYEQGNMGEQKEALDMAIKALEQEPCEDAISREYLVEHIKACWTNGRPMYSPDLSELLSWIDDVPSIQPKYNAMEAIRMALRMLRKDLRKLPPVTSRSLNPEADREESKAYCAECDHIEMCSWYPHDGCEWLKTDRYNAGYNAAKREIALSGEYERAYERGKADAHPDINDGKLSEIPTGSESEKSNDIR